MVGAVKGHILHQRTKFYKDRSNCYGDIAILDFQKFEILTVRGQYASLYQILSKSVKRLQRYSDLTAFSKWRPSAILDLLGADWDHPRRVLDGLYRCANFVEIDAVVSIARNFQYFARLA